MLIIAGVIGCGGRLGDQGELDAASPVGDAFADDGSAAASPDGSPVDGFGVDNTSAHDARDTVMFTFQKRP